MKHIVCYFDGCCEPRNPGGSMGYGAIVEVNGETKLSWSGFDPADPKNTNNIAEYKALEKILDFLIENDLTGEPITIKGDSQLAVKQMKGEYGINGGAYVPFAISCLTKAAQFKKVPKFEWIPRLENQQCDDLSKQVLIQKTGYNENAFQFGKYKGKLISDCIDISYLEWMLRELNVQKHIKEKIEHQISKLEYLSK